MPSALVQCYTFDGKGNNIKKPQWGGVEQELLRAEGSRYVIAVFLKKKKKM